jgi:hypothetical protein
MDTYLLNLPELRFKNAAIAKIMSAWRRFIAVIVKVMPIIAAVIAAIAALITIIVAVGPRVRRVIYKC